MGAGFINRLNRPRAAQKIARRNQAIRLVGGPHSSRTAARRSGYRPGSGTRATRNPRLKKLSPGTFRLRAAERQLAA